MLFLETGKIFLGDIVCAFAIDKNSYHSLNIIVTSFDVHNKIVDFFKAQDENKEKVIPYIVARSSDMRFYFFFNCRLRNNWLFSNLVMTFEKCIYTESNTSYSFDLLNLGIPSISSMSLKGENIENFIGYQYFKDNEETLLNGVNFDVSYDSKVLNIFCKITKIIKPLRVDNKSFEIIESIEKPFMFVSILNSDDIFDYFYVLGLFQRALSFCCMTSNLVVNNISFSYRRLDETQHINNLLMRSADVNSFDMSNKNFNLKLEYLSLTCFCNLLKKLNEKENNKSLNLSFLKAMMRRTSFYDNLDSNFIIVVQTFENEFNLAYPEFKANREFKDIIIKMLTESHTILSTEQKDFLEGAKLKLKDFKEFSKSLIPFLELKTGRLSEKVKQMFMNNSYYLPDTFVRESGYFEDKLKEFTRACEHFVDIRNKISHGKSYEVVYTKKDLYIYFSLIVFIYYFYLRDIGLGESILKRNLLCLSSMGYFNDGYEIVKIEDWVNEYGKLLDSVKEYLDN